MEPRVTRSKPATSYDVARKAGVSQATVSRVLNGNDRVTPELRDRVLRVLAELEFVPNASAQSIRTSRTNTIGVVASEMLNPFFPRLLDALTRDARQRGLDVLLWNDDDTDAPMAQAGVAAGTVDGVVFAAARESTRGIAALAGRGVPVVIVNRGAPESPVDQVSSDHEATGYAAAGYFVEHGRREIAAVFGPRDTFASPAREAGFRRRLEEADLRVAGSRWLVGETSYEHGQAAARRILEEGPLPDAVYCSADLIAFGAITAFREAGVRIPDDLWVMGNDGLPMAEWAPFDLTTHRQPVELIAARGMDRLVARMAGDAGAPERILLPTELIVRGSTAYS